MAIKYVTAVRTTRITAVKTAIDVDTTAAKLMIYGGTPFAGGAVSLATFTLAYPCGTVTNGVLTFDCDPVLTTTATAEAGAGGTTATWAKITTTAGVEVCSMLVGISSDSPTPEIVLNNKVLVTGGDVSISAASITEGNA